MTDALDTNDTHTTPPSIGQQLARAREAQSLSISQIAVQLKLKESVIASLEADTLGDTINPTFVKGYVRAYAKIVGLNAEALLAEFSDASPQVINSTRMTSFSKKVARENRDSKWMLATYALVIIVLVFVAMWFYQQHSGSSIAGVELSPSNSNQTDVTSAEDDRDRNPAQLILPPQREQARLPSDTVDGFERGLEAETEISTNISSAGQPSKQAQDTNPTLSNTGLPAPPQTSASEASTNIDTVINALERADPDTQDSLLNDAILDDVTLTPNMPNDVELVFTFEQDCWVKITDNTGTDVAYGVKKAGRTMPVSGQPPFSVVLGAPAGVSLTYAGEAIDMSVFPSNRTARFVLPLPTQE